MESERYWVRHVQSKTVVLALTAMAMVVLGIFTVTTPTAATFAGKVIGVILLCWLCVVGLHAGAASIERGWLLIKLEIVGLISSVILIAIIGFVSPSEKAIRIVFPPFTGAIFLLLVTVPVVTTKWVLQRFEATPSPSELYSVVTSDRLALGMTTIALFAFVYLATVVPEPRSTDGTVIGAVALVWFCVIWFNVSDGSLGRARSLLKIEFVGFVVAFLLAAIGMLATSDVSIQAVLRVPAVLFGILLGLTALVTAAKWGLHRYRGTPTDSNS
jgi:hypothetical protein